jgi:hypothetical protein
MWLNRTVHDLLRCRIPAGRVPRWFSCLLLAGLTFPVLAADGEPQITVLNPTGFPPPIERKSLAPRPASLDGKTVYLVDVTFNNGDVLLEQMQTWLNQQMPQVKTVFRRKKGIYAADDPDLWREIQAANGVMIMAIGH